jgi:hypothetical protein
VRVITWQISWLNRECKDQVILLPGFEPSISPMGFSCGSLVSLVEMGYLLRRLLMVLLSIGCLIDLASLCGSDPVVMLVRMLKVDLLRGKLQ